MRLAILSIPITLLATPAVAQLGKPNGFKIPVQTTITAFHGVTYNGMLGTEVVGSRYFVSGRRDTTATPHYLFELDGAGAYAGLRYAQPAATSTSAWGIRDMARDGTRIWGGLEGTTVHGFNPTSNTFDSSFVAGAGPALVRALTYNPAGNAGAGSFWTGNFSALQYEMATNGAILRSQAVGISGPVYGAATDPGGQAGAQGSIWWFSQGSSTTSPTVLVVWTEMDPVTGAFTGQQHVGDYTIPGGANPGGIAGGASFHLKAGVPTLLALTQADADTIFEQVGRYADQGCVPAVGNLKTNGSPPCTPAPNFRLEASNLPASAAFAEVAIAGAGPGIPPGVFPFLPCGIPGVDITTWILLPAAPVVGGAFTQALPIPPGLLLHLEIYTVMLYIQLNPLRIEVRVRRIVIGS